MRTLISKFPIVFFLGTALIFTACDGDDEPEGPTGPEPGTQSITQITTTNSSYTTLGAALQATGLDATLGGTESFTLFAPTNTAFDRLFDALELTDANGDGTRLDELVNAIGEEAVRNILLYHVLDGTTLAADVPVKAYVASKCTDSPGAFPIDMLLQSNSLGVRVNNGLSNGSAANNTGGDVIAANILATNGVVHGINGVMMLPSVLDVALNNPADFSGYAALAARAGITDTLRSKFGSYTLLIPTPEAFTNANDTLIGGNILGFNAILASYHVVVPQQRIDEIISSEPFFFFTLSEQDIFPITIENEVIMMEDALGTPASIVGRTDIQAQNGVVHGVSRVLIPDLEL